MPGFGTPKRAPLRPSRGTLWDTKTWHPEIVAYHRATRLAGFITIGLGLVTLLASIGYLVYSFLTAFSAAHEIDASAATPTMSTGTTLSLMTVGLAATIVGIILLAAWNRSAKY